MEESEKLYPEPTTGSDTVSETGAATGPATGPSKRKSKSQGDNLDTDISDWFNDGRPIKIFSDYEGTTTTSQLQNVKDIFNPSNKVKCIYLGDIFDNSNFKDTKIEEGKSKCIENANYCALQMIKLFVDNPDDKCRYVVGNRDINKIKLYPLLQFSDGFKWWTNGNSYQDIVVNLLNKVYPSNPNTEPVKWLVESMDTYEPFWNKEYPGCKSSGKTNWQSYSFLAITNLFDRYNKIFGQDCIAGTMSADYTIRGMPNELFGDSIDDVILNIMNKTERFKSDLYNINNRSQKNQANTLEKLKPSYLKPRHIKQEKEIRAAIVFTVFMRMLDKDLFKKDIKQNYVKKSIKIINSTKNNKPDPTLDIKVQDYTITENLSKLGILDGYLYKYLSRAYPSFYAENKEKTNLYLFAHGGITEAFCKSGDNNAFVLLNKVVWSDITLNTHFIQPKMPLEQLPTFTKSSTLINKMIEFNNTYQQYFNSVFDFFSDFINYKGLKGSEKYTNSIELLILLSLSAPTENNKNIKDLGYTSDFSPIQPRLPIDQKLKQYSSMSGAASTYINIYNFCGHASAGIGGYGYRIGDDGTICINTDYSSSLFKKDLNCKNKEDYNKNHLMMTFVNNENTYDLILNGQIEVPTLSHYNFLTHNKNIDAAKKMLDETTNKLTNTKELEKKLQDSKDELHKARIELGTNIKLKLTDNYIIIKYNNYKFNDNDAIVSDAYNKNNDPSKNCFNGVGEIQSFKYKIYSQYTNGNTFFLEEYKEPDVANSSKRRNSFSFGSGSSSSSNMVEEPQHPQHVLEKTSFVGGYKKNNRKSRKTSKQKSHKNRNSKYKLHHSKNTQKNKNKNKNRNRNRNTKKN